MKPVAVITGGSSGIGLEMAKLLARQNYVIILIARNTERLEKALATVRQITQDVYAFRCDITSSAEIAEVARKIKEQFSEVDLLVLSAGVVSVNLVKDYNNVDDLLKDVRVNLIGTMQTVYFFEPLIKNGGKVIFISSGFGLMGAAGYTSYCASKAGIINFAEAWQREVRQRNIRVYVAVPADVDTPMLKKELEIQPQWMKQQSAPRKALPAQLVAKRILKRSKGHKLLVFPSFDVYALYLIRKILPQSWTMMLLDWLFPRPKN